jgi:hypothetical protein
MGIDLAVTVPHDLLVPARFPEVEAVAQQIERAIVDQHISRPTIHNATADAWPAMIAVVMQLYKHRIPVYVDRNLLFLAGPQFAPRSDDDPQIFIGSRKSEPSTRKRRDRRVIATADDLYAYVQDPTYLEQHRLVGRVALVGAHDVVGDPARVVDGEIPATATAWSSPASVILPSTASWLEVAVPAGADGMFLSVDGNDTYVIRCVGGGGQTSDIGTVDSGIPNGMGVGLVFPDGLSSCLSVRVSPLTGDNYYSVAEIGFLVP